MGRHLIELGLKPNENFGRILNIVFEAQLDGLFNDLNGDLSWFEKNKNEIQ